MITAMVVLFASLAPQTETEMRGVLDSPGGDLPFVLTEFGAPYRLLNGSEEIRLSQVTLSATEVQVELPPYDSRLEMTRLAEPGEHGEVWKGTWSKRGARGSVEMPFSWRTWPRVPHPDDPDRMVLGSLFPIEGEPLDVAGRWLVQFASDDAPAVAIFARSTAGWAELPGEIDGTFLTTTGDYRYLAGTARGGGLRLSCFDGAHAFLFSAKLQPDGSLAGDFWSGASWHDTWVAHRDDDAALPDAFELTTLRPGAQLAELRYPDVEGREHRLGDLLGDVTLVMLFGTWCPNCGDAGVFLKELRERYGDSGLRVLGLAFEHGDDRERHARVLAAYRDARGVDWPILLAGSSDKDRASETFPVVDRVRSYPTTLFVDKRGSVRAVHQGFSGPATGEAYAAQGRRFVAIVERLLREAGQ